MASNVIGKKYSTNEITDPPNPHHASIYCPWWDYEESYSLWKRKKCSRGRYGQTANERWVVTLHPSFCWPEVLQWRARPLKRAKRMRGPYGAAHQALSPHPGHGCSQPCALHSTPGGCSSRQPQGQSAQPTEVSGGRCSRSALQTCSVAKVAFSPCCYGMDSNSFTAAEPTALKDRSSFQMTQDIVLRQTRNNLPMSSFEHHPFNKQPGFFQCLKSHGLNIYMQLLQYQLFQLCLLSAAALSKYW